VSIEVTALAAPPPTPDSADGLALLALERATQDRPLALAAVLAEAGLAGAGPDRDGVVLVARTAGGAIVGMASARRQVDEVEIVRMAVAGPERRRGVGRRLLDDLVTWSRPQARTVLLEVRASNVAAQALYSAAGFVPDGRRPGYYPDGEDALLWRLALVGMPDAHGAPGLRSGRG